VRQASVVFEVGGLGHRSRAWPDGEPADRRPRQRRCPTSSGERSTSVHVRRALRTVNVLSRRGCASFFRDRDLRREVRPMNAVSAVGAPPQSTITRLS
jgi:hypothetical protein